MAKKQAEIKDFISIDIDAKEVTDLLTGVLNRVHNRKPLMRELSEQMYEAVMKNFDTEGARLNTVWPSLNLKYAAYKAKKGLSPMKNQATTQMIASIQTRADNDVALVFTNKVYAPTHQFGDPERNIPARPFMLINENDKAYLLKTVKEFVVRK